MATIQLLLNNSEKNHFPVYVIDNQFNYKEILNPTQVARFEKIDIAKSNVVVFDEVIILKPTENKDLSIFRNNFRKLGALLWKQIKTEKLTEIDLYIAANQVETSAFLEGLLLASYQFQKYKSKPIAQQNHKINIINNSLSNDNIDELVKVNTAISQVKNWVNEPVIHLNAEVFAQEMKDFVADEAVSVEIFEKSKIQALKMGGLLAINEGAPNPPTFTVFEYKPENTVNQQPIVLVGKGVVYDTGGLSLKETANSMDIMKCDMAGGAVIAGAIYAAAKNKLPVYVVGLVPATENRPDGNAITPGDVITIMNGTTVEILNTDAEGRVILADALSYAQKYNPLITIDLATLTGSAIMTVGKHAAILCSNTDNEYKTILKNVANETYERVVELPLWEEYEDEIKSDIADIKNIGNGSPAGAITASMFLKQFVTYPWIHLDIAGPAYIKAEDSYLNKNATGYGVRLIYQFLKNISVNG